MSFGEIIDLSTKWVRVRCMDVTSVRCIRFTPEGPAEPAHVRALAAAGQLGEAEFPARFGPCVSEVVPAVRARR